MSKLWIDPYKASARGIAYESWSYVVHHQTLDPARCSAAGIPPDDWSLLRWLEQKEASP